MKKANNVSSKSRICTECLLEFKPISNRQLVCRVCRPTTKARSTEEDRKKTFNLKKASSSNSWKNGIGVYRLIAKKDCCAKCSSDKFLLVHHKDENRENNKPSNLETLCRKCHQINHGCWKVLPKGEELSVLKKKQAAKAKRDEFGRFIKKLPKV